MTAWSISFTVPGVPFPKLRARTVRAGKKVRSFTPEKTVNYEGIVRLAAAAAMRGAPPVSGPVALVVLLFLPVPPSWSGVKQRRAMDCQIFPTARPDATNVAKSIEDAMNQVVYKDDSQIVFGLQFKQYSETPRAEIMVSDFSGIKGCPALSGLF